MSTTRINNAKVKVIIPWRDRGVDPRRAANLEVVMAWWWTWGFDPAIVTDGLNGDAQFNRHMAYNRAIEQFGEADTFVFTEADMLIHPRQIIAAIAMADRAPGLVVPFTQYRYLDDDTTGEIRDSYFSLKRDALAEWWAMETDDQRSIFAIPPEKTMDNGRSIGAVNIVSRYTLGVTGGFTEATSGNWYDDRITEQGFAFLTAPTRFVPGPAVHLYHLPGWEGEHLTDEDKAATERNRMLYQYMKRDIRMRDRQAVRDLMTFRQPVLDGSL